MPLIMGGAEGKRVMTKAHWVLDGVIEQNAGDVGGDIQVGRAISVRFRSDDCPEARFEVTVYATAKTYMELSEPEPDCPHKAAILEVLGEGVARYAPMPEEHLACSFKPGTVDVQAQYTYRRSGGVDGSGVYMSDDSDDITYEWVGADLGYSKDDGIVAEVERATKDAERFIRDWVDNVNSYLKWDGRAPVKY